MAGSRPLNFLVPVTFVVYAVERLADRILTAQRTFTGFLYGGVLGVLGASIPEARFLRQPSRVTYLWVGFIEEAAKLRALWLLAWRLPRFTMRDGIAFGARRRHRVPGLGDRRLRVQRDVHPGWGCH